MSSSLTELAQARINYARELIKHNQYQEARSVLQTTDHPTAAKWLDFLDEFELQDLRTLLVGSSDAPEKRKRQPPRVRWRRVLFAFVASLGVPSFSPSSS